MGTRIDAVAAMAGSDRFARSGRYGLSLIARAAGECLERARVEPREVGLLVNAGLYHERNLGEPALAALLQRAIGANPEDPHGTAPGTFSFDVANGPCGVLNAFQIADGFLRAGTIGRALVVAGDASPGRRSAPGFPYGSTAAAALLSWTESPGGLESFAWHTEPADAALRRATVAFEGDRNVLRITQAEQFDGHAGTAAAKVAAQVLADAGLRPDEVDLALAAPSSAAFLAAFAEHAGIPERALLGASPSATPHTAGLLFALDRASGGRALADARHVLLVAAGAGITAGAALLINAQEEP